MDLKEVKTKISSVENVEKLTSALETFAALKMKKVQQKESDSRPFAFKIMKILKRVDGVLKRKDSVFLREPKEGKILVCVVSSDRGFCGPFNANILRFARKNIEEIKKEGEVEVMPIGKKAIKFFNKKYNVKYSYSGVGDYWELDEVKPISDFLIKSFLEKKFKKVYFIYNFFVSTFSQIPKKNQLLPIDKTIIDNYIEREDIKDDQVEYKLEPSSRLILEAVVPSFVEYLIYQFVLSANAAEHSARMTAMRNASDNASSLLEELRKDYNKARQEQITSEVTEISSTKEAME